MTNDSDAGSVVEHAVRMSGGGMTIRNPHPDTERIYPLGQWITHQQRDGCKVYRRRILVLDDWQEVPRG